MILSTNAMRSLWSDFYAIGYTHRRTYLQRPGVKVHTFTERAFDALFRVLERTDFPQPAEIISTYNVRDIDGDPTTDDPSLHSFAVIAVDINPAKNPFKKGTAFNWAHTQFTPAQVAAVEAIRTKNGQQVWRWGGNTFGDQSHDYMHWQLTCSPDDIGTGIDWWTVDPPSSWAAPFWTQAVEDGVVTEDSQPREPITVEQFITFMYDRFDTSPK